MNFDPMIEKQGPKYPEYRPRTQRDINRAHLRRILFWAALAVMLFLAAFVVELLG